MRHCSRITRWCQGIPYQTTPCHCHTIPYHIKPHHTIPGGWPISISLHQDNKPVSGRGSREINFLCLSPANGQHLDLVTPTMIWVGWVRWGLESDKAEGWPWHIHFFGALQWNILGVRAGQLRNQFTMFGRPTSWLVAPWLGRTCHDMGGLGKVGRGGSIWWNGHLDLKLRWPGWNSKKISS